MKLSKLIPAFLIFTVCLILFSFAKASKTDPKYAIVISADASDTEIYAARVLSEYLSALDGNNYPIINDDQSFEGFRFCVGATSVYDTSDITDKTADSYVIAPFSNGLAIYGAGSRGTVYGVYTFLEDFCGYSVYTAESGMVSTSGSIIIPEERTEYILVNRCYRRAAVVIQREVSYYRLASVNTPCMLLAQYIIIATHNVLMSMILHATP